MKIEVAVEIKIGIEMIVRIMMKNQNMIFHELELQLIGALIMS